MKLFSYNFIFRYLSFCFSVTFSLEGDHLDPKTHQGIWRGIALLGASQGLCCEECDIYGEVSFSSVLDLPRASFFHVFFKQFAYLLFFPPVNPSYSLVIVTTSLFRRTTASHSPSYHKKSFFTCSVETVQVFKILIIFAMHGDKLEQSRKESCDRKTNAVTAETS